MYLQKPRWYIYFHLCIYFFIWKPNVPAALLNRTSFPARSAMPVSTVMYQVSRWAPLWPNGTTVLHAVACSLNCVPRDCTKYTILFMTNSTELMDSHRGLRFLLASHIQSQPVVPMDEFSSDTNASYFHFFEQVRVK